MDVVTYALANSQAKKQIDDALEPFIVTCTPTALDYSGVMDKTVAEIYAAYQAGQKIVFRVAVSATVYIQADCSLMGVESNYTYPSFEGYALQAVNNSLIMLETSVTNDGTKNTYSTTVYILTPAT